MASKEEKTVLKKSTTKQTAAPKAEKKASSTPKLFQKSIRASSAPVPFVVPSPLPVPSVPSITLPPVVPPKAPVSWWVYFVIFLFATATLLIVGYVAIFDPFETSTTPGNTSVGTTIPDNTSSDLVSPPSTTVPSVYSYLSVVDVPEQANFFASGDTECHEASTPATGFEKPTKVSGKLRMDVVVSADIPADGTDEASFRTELERVGKLVELFSKHKFKATLFLTSPFINLANKLGVTEVVAWAKAGNELAIGFDPGTFLGTESPEELADVPFGSWLLALHKQQVELEDLCQCTVTTWSGAGQYPRLYQAAKELGLTAHVDWSDGGMAPASLATVNPWSPTQSGSLKQLETFDPFGTVVYLPNGIYPEQCSGAFYAQAPFAEEDLTYLTKAFYASLSSAAADRVNVFRVAINPNDFADLIDDEDEFAGLNAWFSTIVDPYVRSAQVVPSIDSASSAAFVTWLDQNIGKIDLK